MSSSSPNSEPSPLGIHRHLFYDSWPLISLRHQLERSLFPSTKTRFQETENENQDPSSSWLEPLLKKMKYDKRFLINSQNVHWFNIYTRAV